ncbi:hypothetical protein UFOVP579_5 [uncultured Caudovirales phage]|uniref:Uncharacterized protein n=1 Tax=uncultured Caudovirales phage TaxID=2100421 RepID=A0A6J5LSP6_9CAUD|nr:hypothetical protein UFOVP302_5 [uncultured Caudovirales phage]CAB4168631.1 hypothetical protein UFOVP579_5 [uncultured Caudovirales phage]
MFRCYTLITIQQNSPKRAKTLFFDFCNQFDASDTWVDLTNQAKITVPKNIYVRDQNNKLLPLGGDNVNVGGFDKFSPLFLRGDKIKIEMGYRYYRGNQEILEKSQIFEGYISEVQSKKPIELKAEDNMWLLKQIPCKPQTWNKSVEELVATMLKDHPEITVNKLSSTSIGQIVVQNETVAQFLERMRKDASLEAYFRGNELRVGSLVYLPGDNIVNGKIIFKKFVFQGNIITDELTYKRKDDVIMSAVVTSQFETVNGTTKDGQAKTKKERLEILVYWNKKKNDWDYIKKEKGKDLPANTEGERRTVPLVNVSSVAVMFKAGKDAIQKYFYEGFRGKFTTFAIPYVRQGDNVIIEDPILPERNGKYKVKGVNYSGGVSGHRQEIILDFLIP